MKQTSDGAQRTGTLETRAAHPAGYPAAHNGARREGPDALVADIERTRDDLARTIDAIAGRVSPANVARRTVDRARARVARIDPMVAGGAAVAVTAATAAVFLLRRRKRRLSRVIPLTW